MTLISSVRRKLLLGIAGAALVSTLPATSHAGEAIDEVRNLRFYNQHTDEHGVGRYWVNGHYQTNVLDHFSHLLRDHRENESIPMDKRLFDFAFQLTQSLNYSDELHVISGYRSPKTNRMLARNNPNVAKRSYHIQGMALDIIVPGVKLAKVHHAALALKLGGVGYYPHAGFVHIDSGPIRSWYA